MVCCSGPKELECAYHLFNLQICEYVAGVQIEVLQEVGCIDTELVVQLKGRVACELNSCDELIATECLFDNQLGDLDPAEAVALLSSLVFQQKDASEPMLTERLEQAKDMLYNTAIRLGHVQKSFDLSLDPEDYARANLKFGLMEVVYEWAKVLAHSYTLWNSFKTIPSNLLQFYLFPLSQLKVHFACLSSTGWFTCSLGYILLPTLPETQLSHVMVLLY